MNAKEKLVQLREDLDIEESIIMPCIAFLKREIAKEHIGEEAFWKQKSQEKWFQVGYKNSKFFHASVKSTRIRNSLHFLIDEHGMNARKKDLKGK